MNLTSTYSPLLHLTHRPFQRAGLHTEDPTGQSSYIPLSSHSHLAPGPLLFSSPAKGTSSGFSRWSYGTGSSATHQNQKGGELQDVDMTHHNDDLENRSSRAGGEELVDVEMYSDSPLKVHGSGNANANNQDSHSASNLNSNPNSTSDKIPSTEKEKEKESSSVLRPISLNGVKKELKRRLKDHGAENKDKPSSSSGALVLREESDEEDVGNDTIDVSSPDSVYSSSSSSRKAYDVYPSP